MGLKEVLSKLKLVEVSEPAARRRASVAWRAGRAGAAPGRRTRRSSKSCCAAFRRRNRSTSRPWPDGAARGGLRAPAAAGAPSTGWSVRRRGSAAEPSAPPPLPPTTSSSCPIFPSVYRAAGIGDPPHGFTAFKVLEMLQSPGLAELPPQAKASALAGFLKMNPGGPVAIGEIIQDAVRRDQALDRFEQFLQAKLAERQAAVERANAALQAEIDALAERHRASHGRQQPRRRRAHRATLRVERRQARRGAQAPVRRRAVRRRQPDQHRFRRR